MASTVIIRIELLNMFKEEATHEARAIWIVGRTKNEIIILSKISLDQKIGSEKSNAETKTHTQKNDEELK